MEYDQLTPKVQALIKSSLDLTRKNLAYTFGSDNPKKGGMDCSGAICHLLRTQGFEKPPRMSHTIYLWLQEHQQLTRLKHVYTPNHPTLRLMKPGDLVFWEGTYAVGERNPPISHVMLYLGTLKADGKGVLFGASSGRRYRGKKIHGVSVFDFKVPTEKSKATLVGFGPIPGIRSLAPPPPAPSENPKPSTSKNGKPLEGLLKVFSKKKP